MELYKLREMLKHIPDQNADVGQIYISNGGIPTVMLTNGTTYVITHKGVVMHDPKYKPRS